MAFFPLFSGVIETTEEYLVVVEEEEVEVEMKVDEEEEEEAGVNVLLVVSGGAYEVGITREAAGAGAAGKGSV